MKLQKGDGLGRCPQCSGEVAVYAKDGQLHMRAHTRSVIVGVRRRDVSCPIAGMDGAAALANATIILESRMARMNADVARAEAALDAARKRAAEAREQRDAYAAQVAAITARVAGKGGV